MKVTPKLINHLSHMSEISLQQLFIKLYNKWIIYINFE